MGAVGQQKLTRAKSERHGKKDTEDRHPEGGGADPEHLGNRALQSNGEHQHHDADLRDVLHDGDRRRVRNCAWELLGERRDGQPGPEFADHSWESKPVAGFTPELGH